MLKRSIKQDAFALPSGEGRRTMILVFSSGASGKSVERRVLGLFSSLLSLSSGLEVSQRVSSSAAMSSNRGVLFALMRSLR